MLRARVRWIRESPLALTAILKRGYGALPDEAQRRLARIGELALRPSARRGLLAALAVLGVELVALRTLRGSGDLVVCIAYPDDLRGSFTVMISQRKPCTGRAPRSERDAAHGRVSSRTEHHLVARETQFRGLTPGRYFTVSLHREENVDDPAHLANLVETLRAVAVRYRFPLVFSVHPRTRKRLEAGRHRLHQLVHPLPPLGPTGNR